MMRCALVHDWLTSMRGGEKMLDLLCEMFPQADLYTMVHTPGSVSERISNRRIKCSVLNRLPAVGRYYPNLLPLMPWAAGRMRLKDYDLVVATSHCVAHGVSVENAGRFVGYCFTPMRYAWDIFSAYRACRPLDPRIGVLGLMRPHLRAWDRRAATRVGEYLAASEHVRKRIRDCYGRESTVIYPPIDTEFFHPLGLPREPFYLWAGALAPYKRVDLFVEAFRRLNRPAVIIGTGQNLGWVRRHAPPNVQVLGWQSNDVLRRYLATCRALVFPGEEDFGIVPVEAQACGCPVIAYGKGGVAETVLPLGSACEGAPTGVFFQEATAEALVEAVVRFEREESAFDPLAMRRQSLRFNRDVCRDALRAYLLREGR